MKRKLLAISLPLFVCLACVWLVSEALTAPPPPPGPTPGLNTPVPLNFADLVVQSVTLAPFSVKEFTSMDLTVRVKNIGKANAASCTVGLGYTDNVGTPFALQTAQTPTLIPNASTTLSYHFTIQASAIEKPGGWQAMMIAAADAPVAGKPSGKVTEAGGEYNNVFGFTFSTAGKPGPWTWNNPAVP